jgi:DNA-binding NarL/FixJ family response regulator
MTTGFTAVVAESRPSFRDLVLRLLAGDLGIDAVTATSLDGAIDALIGTHPDLAVIDRHWPGCDPFALLPAVCQQLPRTYVVLTAGHFSNSDVARMRNTGVRGCLLESAPPDELRTVLRTVLAGGRVFPSAVRGPGTRRSHRRGHRHTAPSPIEDLTVRELQVLTCVGRGLSTKEIASALNVSVKTADRHRTNLMAKLGIHDRVQLALCAVREGLVRA